MAVASALGNSVTYLAIAGLLVFFAYVIVRTASFAYFRTKLEYLRSVLKELHGGERDG